MVFKDVKFAWYPRWVPALILINLLIMAIVAAILTKRVAGKLPFTEEAWAAWRKGRIVFGLGVFGAIVLFIAGVILMASETSVPGGALALVASIAGPIALWVTFLKGKNVVVREITKTHTTLRIPSAEACAKIQAHLSDGGNRRPAMVA